jgi:hypothetical protein
MKMTLTAQQTAFFSKNGYIEFECPFDLSSYFDAAKRALSPRLSSKHPSPSALYVAGRDLWRDAPELKTLLLRKLSFAAHALVKRPLRLGCDQWLPAGLSWEKTASAKDLFSIQGLGLCVLLSPSTAPIPAPSRLGIPPLPSKPGNLLFFLPHILIHWPQLAKLEPVDLYLAAYAQENALYVQNTKDPATNALKSFGYGFGDTLNNQSHPLLPRD